eukprot:448377-Pleurochrysis_carterae.AAC.4
MTSWTETNTVCNSGRQKSSPRACAGGTISSRVAGMLDHEVVMLELVQATTRRRMTAQTLVEAANERVRAPVSAPARA